MRHVVKPEIRIIGWDDARHERSKGHRQKVLLVGVIFRGGSFIDGMLSTSAEVDGTDATRKIAEAVKSTRHYDQLSVIMLDGITVGGFNLVDIHSLNKQTSLPVIAVQRKKPNVKEFLKGLKIVFPRNYEQMEKIVRKTGRVIKFEKNGVVMFYQKAGLTAKMAEEILAVSTTRGNIPEPLRVAHLIAGGLSGESRGGA